MTFGFFIFHCAAIQKNYFCSPVALVAELVDALDSKSSAERRGGSIPSWSTKAHLFDGLFLS
jgi:hypothetical protein